MLNGLNLKRINTENLISVLELSNTNAAILINDADNNITHKVEIKDNNLLDYFNIFSIKNFFLPENSPSEVIIRNNKLHGMYNIISLIDNVFNNKAFKLKFDITKFNGKQDETYYNSKDKVDTIVGALLNNVDLIANKSPEVPNMMSSNPIVIFSEKHSEFLKENTTIKLEYKVVLLVFKDLEILKPFTIVLRPDDNINILFQNCKIPNLTLERTPEIVSINEPFENVKKNSLNFGEMMLILLFLYFVFCLCNQKKTIKLNL